VREALGDRVDCILNGGPTTVGIESTVLSLAVSPPQLLRPGMVSQSEIEALIGPIQLGQATGAHASPGMHRVHYSPRTRLVIVSGGAPLPAGRGVYLFRERPLEAAKRIVMPGGAAAYAALLYETLHREDRAGWDWIAVEEPPSQTEWAAILDRLRHAASATR
jgi:L-threonylcarbamoyladenylate synthase